MHSTSLSKTSNRVSWVLQLVAAGILGQTLFFKFSASRESVYIFETLGMEPWGRIGTAVIELVAVVLLLVPRTAALGALIAIGVMLGAMVSHFTRLGIAIVVDGKSDGGLLFILAVTTLISATIVAWLRRTELPIVGCKFAHNGRNAHVVG